MMSYQRCSQCNAGCLIKNHVIQWICRRCGEVMKKLKRNNPLVQVVLALVEFINETSEMMKNDDHR